MKILRLEAILIPTDTFMQSRLLCLNFYSVHWLPILTLYNPKLTYRFKA